MEIAWIGTGIMGAPMARRLIGGPHHLRVFNRTPEKARALAADGAIVTADAAACVAGAEIVFIMVPDTPDVEATVAKIEPALKSGQLVVDMSTVSPAAERAIAMRLKAAGASAHATARSRLWSAEMRPRSTGRTRCSICSGKGSRTWARRARAR